MKVKGMKNVNPEKDSALYTNLDDYTLYYYELPKQYLSKNTKGCIVSETEIKLGDSNFNHFIAEIKKIALTLLKSKNNGCIINYTIHFSNTRKNRYLKINWCFMWCTSIDELSYLYKL